MIALCRCDWPAEYAEDEVEHEERADDDERNVVDPRKRASERVVRLQYTAFVVIVV